MCARFGVSTSGFYAWEKREPSKRIKRDKVLLKQIRKVHRGNRKAYGSPRIHKALRAKGIVCSRRRVARVMREHGIKASVVGLYTRRPTKYDVYQQSDNVLGEVPMATQKNEQWVADYTYLKTKEGWYYFAMVLDRFTRKLVGWAFSDVRNSNLTIAAFNMAVRRENKPRGLIFHTDRGIEYVSSQFQNRLREFDMVSSMSRKGRCTDNAMAESFFHSLKTEKVHHKRYLTKSDAKKDILNYIDFYNQERLHSSLDYLSPTEFEKLAA